jgi:starvation-inducible DNA-binding protein
MHAHDDAIKVDLAESLACLLASAYTVQLKLHGFHWNVKGRDFAEFHDFFRMLQEDVYGSIDGLAENILKLGYDAPGSLSDMLELSCIGDGTVHVGEPIDMAMQFLHDNEHLIEKLQAAGELAGTCREYGIQDFLAGREDMHKKWSWQARAISGLQPSRRLGKAGADLLQIAEVVIPAMVEDQLIAVAPCCSQGCLCMPGACACGPECMCGCKNQMIVATAKADKPVKTALSASGKRKIFFSKSVDEALKEKVKVHNEKAPSGRKASLSTLRAVYRRGVHEHASSLSSVKELDAVAMSRVNAFLRLVASGSVTASGYTKDKDLLPDGHVLSSRSKALITASITASMVAEHELYVTLKTESEYASTTDAIVAMAEYSGLSYDVIPALKAAWTRAVKNNENPFERTKNLSASLYDSKDADLLPRRKVDTL